MNNFTIQNREEGGGDGQNGNNSPRMSPVLRNVLPILVCIAVAGLLFAAVRGLSPETVATVNGEAITRSEFETRLDQFTAFYESGNLPTDTPEAQRTIRSQTLQSLIDDAVLLEAARENDIAVSEEEAESVLQQQKSAFETEEAFQEWLETAHVSEEQFKREIQIELTINEYLRATAPASVTEATEEEVERVKSIIEQNPSAGSNITEEQIEETIVNQKLLTYRLEEAARLKEEADIEIFLEDEATVAPEAEGVENSQEESPEPEEAENLPEGESGEEVAE